MGSPHQNDIHHRGTETRRNTKSKARFVRTELAENKETLATENVIASYTGDS
jgi:hypothetical protein